MMNFTKKIVSSVVVLANAIPLVSITSCAKPMYENLKWIAPYTHEITFNDYNYDADFVTTKDAEAFGCSSVHKGNFYGRNFDYIYNDTPEFVVRVKANEEKHRHESIGIATHFGLRENKLLNGEYDKQLELIPNVTLDGINDAGVICSHNVVSTESLKSKTGQDIEPQTNPNNPNAFQLHQLFIPRYVLDNASSAKQAVELLQDPNINIKGDLGGNHFLHIMIADKDETYVVEFFDNTPNDGNSHFNVVVEKKTGDEQIMTNYFVNNRDSTTPEDLYFINDKKNGNERMAILKDGYDAVQSFTDMQNLMKTVMYSIAYRFNHNIVPLGRTLTDSLGNAISGDLTSDWYSEVFNQSDINDSQITKISDLDQLVKRFDNLKTDYWNTRILDIRNPANPVFWQTTHNSTYDIEHKHLRLIVQEQYQEYYDYYL